MKHERFFLASGTNYHEKFTILDGKSLNLDKICVQAEKYEFIDLCRAYADVFSCQISDIRGSDPSLAQHTFQLEADLNQVR